MPYNFYKEPGEYDDVLTDIIDHDICWVLHFESNRRIALFKDSTLPWKFWDLVRNIDPTLSKVLERNPRIAQAMALRKLEDLAESHTRVVVNVRRAGGGGFGFCLDVPVIQ